MEMRETEEGLLFEGELSTARQLPVVNFQLTNYHSVAWNADGAVTREWEGDDGVRHKEVDAPVPFKIPDGYEWRMQGDEDCEVYWGSHGCALRKGHRGELHYACTDPRNWWRFRVGRRVPYRLRRLRCQLFGHRLQSDGVCTTCWTQPRLAVSSEE